jgi:hypothetical protein
MYKDFVHLAGDKRSSFLNHYEGGKRVIQPVYAMGETLKDKRV